MQRGTVPYNSIRKALHHVARHIVRFCPDCQLFPLPADGCCCLLKCSKVKIAEYEDESVEMIQNLHPEAAHDRPPGRVDSPRPARSPDKLGKTTTRPADRSPSKSPEKSPKPALKPKGNTPNGEQIAVSM